MSVRLSGGGRELGDDLGRHLGHQLVHRTLAGHIQQLLANPPKFVIAALLEGGAPRILSAPLQQLLSQRYTLRLTSKNSAFADPGSQGLYERND